ncbi:MAG: diguanylate cyclase domain-containing protein [Wolinella sp.]
MKRHVLGIISFVSLLLLGIMTVVSFQNLKRYDDLEMQTIRHESLRAFYMIKSFWDERKLSLTANSDYNPHIIELLHPESEKSLNILKSLGIELSLLQSRLQNERFVILPTSTPFHWSIWTHTADENSLKGEIFSLDARVEKRFMEFLQHSVKIVPKPTSSPLKNARLFFEEQEITYNFIGKDTFIDIYLPFSDSLALQVTLDRGLFVILRSNYRTAIFYVLLSIGLTLIFLYITLERIVLSRISNISQKIREIEESHNLSLRITPIGKDELGNLAIWINGMLAEIERFQQRELDKKEVIIEEERRFLQNIIDSWNHALLVMRDSTILKINNAFKHIFGDPDTLIPSARDELLLPILDAKPLEIISVYQAKEQLFFRLDSHTLDKGEKLITLTDISSLNHQIQNLQDIAMKDPLTGLLNRNGILKEFHEHFTHDSFGMLLFDIDHFKHINDTYGHPVGDKTLRGFAEILKLHQNNERIFARWGGEEFLMIQKGDQISILKEIAEMIRIALKAHKFSDLKNKTFHVSVSAGGGIRVQNEEFNALYDRVDRNLYQAKENGRDQSVVI